MRMHFCMSCSSYFFLLSNVILQHRHALFCFLFSSQQLQQERPHPSSRQVKAVVDAGRHRGTGLLSQRMLTPSPSPPPCSSQDVKKPPKTCTYSCVCVYVFVCECESWKSCTSFSNYIIPLTCYIIICSEVPLIYYYRITLMF